MGGTPSPLPTPMKVSCTFLKDFYPLSREQLFEIYEMTAIVTLYKPILSLSQKWMHSPNLPFGIYKVPEDRNPLLRKFLHF